MLSLAREWLLSPSGWSIGGVRLLRYSISIGQLKVSWQNAEDHGQNVINRMQMVLHAVEAYK